ncbi:MAG: polysaccharide pyruvyl transferase family protein, partial [Burkholderiaceae bacterium]
MATTILFGAFDRHNLGDLLFAHVAAALLPRDETVVFAGLAARDLRPFGGHRVEALHALRDDRRLRGARLVHVGGEILTCRARDAAVMLVDPAQVDATLAFLAAHPDAEAGWRRALLGTDDELPYVVGRDALRWLASIAFAGVGGVALGTLPDAARATLLARLAGADALTVRDAVTQAQLHAAGVVAPLMPDPAELVETLFGDAIRARVNAPALAGLRRAFPGGWLAVQLSTEFADDATLAQLAGQLAAIPHATGLGIVLFRAGAAPWHDDPALLARLARRLPARHVRLFDSL